MQIHSKALHKACLNLSVDFKTIGSNVDFTEVKINGKTYHFNASSHPLNSAVVSRICKDKGLTYDLLHEKIKMPKTKTYIDPFTDKNFLEPFIECNTFNEIVENIEEKFTLPIIIKKNQGSQGRNVFKVNNIEQLTTGIKAIFDKDSQFYDYAMLAQECIDIKHEYRVIVLNGEILFMYEKDNSRAEFEGNLSPLHWKNSKAIFIKDQKLKIKINNFAKPIFENLDLEFGGLDVAIDKNNEMYLIEINTTIGLDYFVRDNGMEEVVKMYERILLELRT